MGGKKPLWDYHHERACHGDTNQKGHVCHNQLACKKEESINGHFRPFLLALTIQLRCNERGHCLHFVIT